MRKGFTLIELLAVIVILAIILVMAVPEVIDAIQESKDRAFQASAISIYKTIESQLISGHIGYTSNDFIYNNAFWFMCPSNIWDEDNGNCRYTYDNYDAIQLTQTLAVVLYRASGKYEGAGDVYVGPDLILNDKFTIDTSSNIDDYILSNFIDSTDEYYTEINQEFINASQTLKDDLIVLADDNLLTEDITTNCPSSTWDILKAECKYNFERYFLSAYDAELGWVETTEPAYLIDIYLYYPKLEYVGANSIEIFYDTEGYDEIYWMDEDRILEIESQ